MFLTKMRASGGDRSAYGNFYFQPVPSRSGGVMTPDRCLQLPVVLACVRVLAESFANLDLKIYKRSSKGRKLLAKHWLYDLLTRAPNVYQSPFEWTEMMQAHLALRGNAYNQIVSNRSGDVIALMPLHPDRITVEMIPGSDMDYRYRYNDRTGKMRVFTREELWHLRGLSSDGIMGLSMIGLAAASVGLGLNAQDYGARFFQNDAKPSGWIETTQTFKDKAQREQFRESWQESQTGRNRSKTAVLEYGMKYHELGLTNKDSQFLEARQFQVTDIARIFRVPPHMVGDLNKASFSNIEQQSLDFVTNTMLSWANRWESSIETTLLTDSERDIEVKFDFTSLLRGDQAARAMYYHNGILDGWMTRNEARDAENMAPIDGLDEPLVPLNMVEEKNIDAAEAPGAPPTTDQGTGKPANPQKEPTDARIATLLRGNAARMARRVEAGNPPTADVLADALAISADVAAAWLTLVETGVAEGENLTDSLIELGTNP